MKLKLFGSPRVEFGTFQLDVPQTKPMLLLFYLALRGTWVSRESLALFFRPDADEVTARHYVRKLLNGALQMPWAHKLEVQNDRLRWLVDTDVERFCEHAKEGRYKQALDLYSDALLSELRVDGSGNFEGWLYDEREELHALWHRSGLGHATDLESAGEHYEAAMTAKMLLQANSLAEDALQSYVRNIYLAGKRELALRAADSFSRELEREMGLEPLEETQQLIQTITRSLPVTRAAASAKEGRRSTDEPRSQAAQQHFHELVELLQTPGTRLLDVQTIGETGQTALILAQSTPTDTDVPYAIIELAELLTARGYYRRALELLPLICEHPACDARAHKSAERLRAFLEGAEPRSRVERFSVVGP